MSEINPYQQPQAELVDDNNPPAQPLIILAEPRKISAGDALGWISSGHKMLPGHWGVVLGALVVTVLITSAFQIIPLLGMIAQILATPLLYAGIVKIFHRMETEGTSDFADLFAAFFLRCAFEMYGGPFHQPAASSLSGRQLAVAVRWDCSIMTLKLSENCG